MKRNMRAGLTERQQSVLRAVNATGREGLVSDPATERVLSSLCRKDYVFYDHYRDKPCYRLTELGVAAIATIGW